MAIKILNELLDFSSHSSVVENSGHVGYEAVKVG